MLGSCGCTCTSKVETYGVWMLKTIAITTTFKNGLSWAAAYKNLIEQLSVKLISYNVKMILNHMSITQDDSWDIPL